MRKNIVIIAIIIIFYGIPLIGKPPNIFHPQIIILMAVCWVLLYTQPAFNYKGFAEKKDSDHCSIMVNIIATTLSQVAAVIDWGYFQDQTSFGIISLIGFCLMIGGSLFRIWAIRILGRFFTATVQIQDGQRIIQGGPYRIVRHPSYLGAYAAIIGSTLFLQSVIGLAVAVIGMGIAYKMRIDTEEETLIGAFGDDYLSYQSQTNRMIPYIW